MNSYPYPKHLANRTANEMNLWDALYYLAYRTGGRILVSSAELVTLTGIPRQRLSPLLNRLVNEGRLRKEDNLALDAPTGHHYLLYLSAYPPLTPVIDKPVEYVTRQWLKAIRNAIPRRLLNYMFLHSDEPLILSDKRLRKALRSPKARHPLPSKSLYRAVAHLVELGLLESRENGRYHFCPETLNGPPPLAFLPANRYDGPRFRQAYAEEPLLACRAAHLIEQYHLTFENDFNFLFQLLKQLDGGQITWLQQLVQKTRALLPEERHKIVLEKMPSHRMPLPDFLWLRLRETSWAIIHEALEGLRRDQLDPLAAVRRPQAEIAYAEMWRSGSVLAVIGPAGSGKTTQLSRWAVEAMQQQEHTVLLLQGAKLPPRPSPRALLAPLTQTLDLLPESLFSAVGDGKTLLLIVDAVNEAPDPHLLLVTLLDLWQRGGMHSLRLVISCRDVTWRRLTHTIQLPERIHQVSLGNFDAKELRRAYQIYRQHYGLPIPLDRLPKRLRRLLHHPLFLELFTRAQRESLWSAAGLTDGWLIGNYLDRVITDLLTRQMLNQTVRRMVQERTTALPRALVWKDPEDPQQTRAYTLLLENRILSEGWRAGKPRVWITYEQIGEYLLGRYALPAHLEREVVLQTLEKSRTYHALWGALVQRLATDLSLEQLEQWSSDPVPALRNLVRDALILRYTWSDKITHDAVMRLVSKGAPQAAIVGLEVALKHRLVQVFLAGIDRGEAEVREQAILHFYYLWRQLWGEWEHVEGQSAWELLERLSGQTTQRFGLPRRRQLEALLWLTSVVVTLHFDPDAPDKLVPLINMWRELLGRLPLSSGHLSRLVWASLARAGEKILDELLRSAPSEASLLKTDDVVLKIFRQWAEGSDEAKAFFEDTLARLDDGTLLADAEEVEQRIIIMAEANQTMEWGLATSLGMLNHAVRPARTTALLRRMWQQPSGSAIFHCATSIALEVWNQTPEIHSLAHRAMVKAWEELKGGAPATSVNWAMLFRHKIQSGETDLCPLVRHLMAYDWARKDPKAAFILIEALELTAMHGAPVSAMQALALFFADERPAVRTALVQTLVRLRVLFIGEVSYILDHAPADVQQDVETATAPRVLWLLTGTQIWEASIRMSRTAAFRHFLIDIFRRMLQGKNWSQARRIAISYLMAWLRGE